MQKGEGKFLRQHKGIGYAAKVSLNVDTNSDSPYVTIECNGYGYDGQGYIEEATKDGYSDWKNGAVEGAKFALKLSGNQNYGVIITNIEGLTTDTNATIVAIATAYAVWDAINFKVPLVLKEQIEAVAFDSWSNPECVIDSFYNIIF